MLIDMTNITIADLAYAAGIVDGEGGICVNKAAYVQKGGSRSYMVTVRVCQKSDEIPIWLQLTFGGKLRRLGREKTTHRADGRETTFVPMWAWEVYCQDAADFLEAIVPYLKMKKHRSELAIQLARMHRRRGGWGGRYGGRAVTPEENAARESVALQIRAENLKSNSAIRSRVTWGVN